jgi:hypothetical protein
MSKTTEGDVGMVRRGAVFDRSVLFEDLRELRQVSGCIESKITELLHLFRHLL